MYHKNVISWLRRVAKWLTIAAGVYRPARRLYRRKAYLEEIRFYRSFLPANALCFDVGANVGDKSEAMLGAVARVVAFEPNPLLLGQLIARFRGEKNWTMIPAAAGSAPDLLSFYAREIHGLSSLDVEGAQEWQGSLAGMFRVPVVTLDSAIREFGAPFYCKIDVEGWELEVLNGLTKPIPIISFEFHLNGRDIEKTKACLRRLRGLGKGYANVAPAEQGNFLFERWMELDRFLDWFPGDLQQRLNGKEYGDIFVRNTPT